MVLNMQIKLDQVHIQNLRSIRSADVSLSPFSVMFGMNDSGKSNFVLALRLALGNGAIDSKDVFCSPEKPYCLDDVVVIDLKFIAVDAKGDRTDSFNELWGLHLGNNVMIDYDDKEFFAFRTEFIYDIEKEEYIRDRKIITEWNNSTKAG